MSLIKEREPFFPYLEQEGYEEKSPNTPDRDYNCAAFAADIENRAWWPIDDPEYYWPIEPREESPEGFEKAFRLLGYEPCENSSLESGFEKVAFFMDFGMMTHVAKQVPDGRWKSKMGLELEDIVHNTLKAVEGRYPGFGKASFFMKRRTKNEPEKQI